MEQELILNCEFIYIAFCNFTRLLPLDTKLHDEASARHCSCFCSKAIEWWILIHAIRRLAAGFVGKIATARRWIFSRRAVARFAADSKIAVGAERWRVQTAVSNRAEQKYRRAVEVHGQLNMVDTRRSAPCFAFSFLLTGGKKIF